MAGSEDIFRGISSVTPVAGLLWFSKARLSTGFVTRGLIFLTVSFMIMIISFLMISSSLWKFYEGGATNLPLIINFSYITFLSIFYIINAKKVIQNHQNLLQLQKSFGLSSVQGKSVFQTSLAKHAIKLNMLIKFQFWFNYLLSPLNTLIKILYWNNIIDVQSENDLIYKIYFDVSNSYMFWPTVTLQAISLHVLVTFQTVNDLYILSVLTLQLVSFQHLQAELANILSLKSYRAVLTPEEFGTNKSMYNPVLNNLEYIIENDNYVNYKLQQWIQQHTYTLRLEFKKFLNTIKNIVYSCNKIIRYKINNNASCNLN